MEGISGIVDARELLAFCDEYWSSGRALMTADVVSAAQGLLDAGVREVVVIDNHASGGPGNVIAAELPRGARLEWIQAFDLAGHVDAMLQVGYHPRGGLPGFVPHTYVPGIRMWANDEEISESHGRAWASGVPLLGITGHEEHGRTLGSLQGTPFLCVQEGTDPLRARPSYTRRDEAAWAIRNFARQCAEAFADAPVPRPPDAPALRATLRPAPDGAAQLMTDAGWAAVDDDCFTADIASWSEAAPLVDAAMQAAMSPFAEHLRAMDLSSRGALQGEDRGRAEELLDLFVAAV